MANPRGTCPLPSIAQPTSSSTTLPTSPAESNPICLFPHLISPIPQTLIMKSNLRGTFATITSPTGQTVLTIEAPFLSRSHRKNVFDNNGALLFTVRKGRSSLGVSHYYFESAVDKHHILELHSEWIGRSSARTTATFVDAVSQQEEVLEVEGAAIVETETGCVVARIDREKLQLRHTYRLMVMAGVDLALVVGVMMCLDEMERGCEDERAFASEVYTI